MTLTAQRLNNPVRVLATTRERLHMIHVHHVRENERRTAGSTIAQRLAGHL
ncbi:hypothetical protein OG609_16105 [Streptomyces sp. NBC_01224]|nr:hypothetical protein OG609_16105 [Streptomyces sp. NBC_01224]